MNPENGFEWGGQHMARGIGVPPHTAVNIINAVLMRKSAVAQLTK